MLSAADLFFFSKEYLLPQELINETATTRKNTWIIIFLNPANYCLFRFLAKT